MQSCLDIFTTEVVNINKKQPFHFTSYKSACILLYLYFSCIATFYFFLRYNKWEKKGNKPTKLEPKTVGENDREKKKIIAAVVHTSARDNGWEIKLEILSDIINKEKKLLNYQIPALQTMI